MSSGLTKQQKKDVERYEALLAKQLASKPKRLAHSLSVGTCAQSLANTYGVDIYESRVAGILHDWEKASSASDLLDRARAYGIDLGVDLTLVQPLLHGLVAQRELATLMPELSAEVLQAIGRHTIGSAEMSPLDMVIFVADGIEPLRPSTPGIDHVRSLVGNASLADLYFESFSSGVEYVVETRRYLYPGTLDIYNQLVENRFQKENA